MKFNLKIAIALIVLILFIDKAYSQINFKRNDSIVVLNNIGDTLKNPWVGGFNSVQFSEIDVNIDGFKDLFVFDRTGFRVSVFINKGTPNTVTYKHAPEYSKLFPYLRDWVLLRDYNCDGKMDIFTYSSGGMAVYKNTSTTSLTFDLQTNLLYSDYQPDAAPNYINLYVSSVDIPAIDDIDGDGDLDVLTFSITGSYVEYHKNLSMDKHGTCDSLDFQLNNKCWGFFKENLTSNSVTLLDTCSFNVANPQKQSGGSKHAGSTLLTLDIDSTGSKDLVLADVSYNNFTLLVNQDTTSNYTASSISSQDTTFPSNNSLTLATDIDIFPAGFYLDVNNDNIKDLIASPNCYNGCTNSDNVWYYNNTGVNNYPDFEYQQNDFIQEGIIEVGEGAHPVFFDYNADGLMDILIGSYGNFNPSVGPLLYESSLWLYENIGTASNPAFRLVDTDYANISSMNLDLSGSQPTLGLAPAFGDIDGDGDDDMMLGDYHGYIHYFRNTAGMGNPPNFVINQVRFEGFDVGQDATPILYDIDNDMLLDLIVGNQLGTFYYYHNDGTSTNPIFNHVTDSLGKVTTRNTFDFRGNSNPIFVDSSGTTILYSGAANGHIYKFGNINGNLSGKFTRDSTYLNIKDGVNTFVAVKDITNDGNLDMLIGNYSGGIVYYDGDTSAVIISVNESAQLFDDINIYPNPTNNQITVDLGTAPSKNTTLEVMDLVGKVLHNQILTTTKTTINLSNYSQGVYLVKITNDRGNKVYKVIKE